MTDEPKASTEAEQIIKIDPSEIDADMPGRIGLFYSVKADGLAARIEADGQLEPILVSTTGPRAKMRFRLVAGLHRLKACEQLGRKVHVRIVKGSADELLRMQAAENLDRRQMTVLERSMFIAAVAEAAMKRVSDAHGGASQQEIAIKARWNTRGNLHRVSEVAPIRAGDDVASADMEAISAMDGLNQIYGWRDEVSEACGLSLDAVKRALRIYRCIVEPFRDLMDQLKDHPASDNASKLLAVAGVALSARRDALMALMAEEAAPKPAPAADEGKFINKFVQLFTRRLSSTDDKKGAIYSLFSSIEERRLLIFSAETLIEKLGAERVAKLCAERAEGGAQ